MTAKRVDMATPDNLLFLDTDPANSSLSSVPIEQDEPDRAPGDQTNDSFSPVPDQHTHSALESSELMPVPCQDGTMEIHSENIHKEGENESSVVITQPLDHTALTQMTINHPNDAKSDNCGFDIVAVMETDTINSPHLIHLIDTDNMRERTQIDKHTGLSNTEDPNEACETLVSPEVSSLTEHKRHEEMSQYTILNQFASSLDGDVVESVIAYKTLTESFTTAQPSSTEDPKTEVPACLPALHEADNLNIEKMANNDSPMVNTVFDVKNNEHIPGQSFLTTSNASSSEFLFQTYLDSPKSVDLTVQVTTDFKTLPEICEIAEDLACGSLTTSQTPTVEGPMSDRPISLADLHQTDTVNILTNSSTLFDTLGKYNIWETPDMPVNESEMIQPVNKDSNYEFCTGILTQMVQNLQFSEHDVTELELTRTDNILNLYASSKSVGVQVSQVANDDISVFDVLNSEQSLNQPLSIASNETDATSFEPLIQTCQDKPVCDVTVEAATTYETHPEMRDIAEDLTCCGFTNSEIPKKEMPKIGDHLSLADSHEADTVNILTHASALLNSLGINNVSETADVPVNDSEIIHTVNKHLAASSVEFCTCILSQTVPNLLQNLEHDQTETESKRINDSFDRIIDTKISSEAKPFQANSESVFSQSLPDTIQIGEKHEKDLSQVIPCPTLVLNPDLGECSEEIKSSCLRFTGTERDVEAGSELWLDAHQFLAGEEDESAIFDKWGQSRSSSPPTARPDNTKASDYSRRENISIDHHAEDRELRFPPVERWSSSDSWASALSDWFQAVNTYPEDSNTGSKLSMAIQDNILEPTISSDNAKNVGQTCLSLNLLEPDEPGQALSRGLAESDNTNGTLFKQGDKDRLPSHSDSDRQENHMSLLESLDKFESHKPDKKAVMDMFIASNSCVSSADELSGKLYGSQFISGERLSAKSEGNVLVEVTGDKVSQLGLVFEEERESSFSSPRISTYTSDKNLTGSVSNKEQRHSSDVHLRICPSQLDSHVSCKAGCAEGSFVHSNTEDFTVKPREEDKNTIPQFIMPFAPLGTGNTFLHHRFLKEDSRHADLDLPPKSITNEINLKSDQKSISSEDSSEDRFHTCPDPSSSSSYGDSDDPSIKETKRKVQKDISKELSKLLLLTGERFMVSEDKRVAYVTLDLEESTNISLFSLSNSEEQPKTDSMPHKTSKTSSDGKGTRVKHKEKPDDKHQHGFQALKKQDLQPPSQVKKDLKSEGAGCEDRPVTVIETIVITEKIIPKTQGKKKKKHAQHGTPKPENNPPSDVGSRSAQINTSGKAENLEVEVTSDGLNKSASHPSTKMDITNKDSTQKVMSVRPKVEPRGGFGAKMDPVSVNASQKAAPIKLKVDTSNAAKMENKTCTSESPNTCLSSTLNDDIKRRRIADDLSGAVPIRTRPQLPAIFRQTRNDGEDMTRRAYSEVVKQKTPKPKEAVVPRVVSEIQADPVPADPQNILLWCQFSPVPPDATVKWTKEGTVLSEINKVEKDDGRFTMTILKACSRDLGLYKCSLNAGNISVSTSEYHLTSEVFMELVIPSHDEPAEPRLVDGDEENIQCSPLLFKEDFLLDQYFGENQPASILTEKVHFGEGMHRKAFRTTLREGNLPRFKPGHPCVLKVHNAISYGTKNNEELVQRNYSLAVEECHVQNTAREYIKAYNSVAKSAESFGEVPEIIPIYLVHRPSNDIPYATLEEELLGDFVKYSVKDGKEINLMRRDSEAGQKCCAFQHWVFSQTEGNLLVTDMQGVGMKLTDVGIATCKKGYKGFRGNCATSFIDQFKALHQCNRYCELLGLTSLQPKPKRTVGQPKPKTQPVPKKKPFSPVLNGKS